MAASIEEQAVKQELAEQTNDTRKSASTLLVEIATDQFKFGVSKTGETFGVPYSGPKVVKLLRGSKTSLRSTLAREFFARHGKAASQQALADALMVIDGLAQEADETELYLRVCGSAGQAGIECGSSPCDLWLDMGDPTGRAIRVTADGWNIVPRPPMLFKRTLLMGALPEPARDGALDELWEWLNVEAADRPLLVAWLVAALIADMPHPILSFFGEQGTGKTTAQKIVVSVIDPGPVPTRKPPRDADAWVTAAAGSWVVGLDNLSTVSDWLSDSLCRAVTGDGDVRRKLYTDGEHAVFSFRRCLCLTSIDLGAVRGDLGERMLLINLHIIADEKRLMESEIWPRWAKAHPRILGGLLDVAAGVIRALPFVELTCKPRMADFARIVAAVDTVLNSSGLAHYLSKQTALAADSLDGDPFIAALSRLDSFDGTASELLELVKTDRPPKGWPANARAVTQLLRRQAPVMRKAGWQIRDDGGQNRSKVIRWQFTCPETVRIPSPQHPQHPQNTPKRGFAGNAGHDYRQSRDESLLREVEL